MRRIVPALIVLLVACGSAVEPTPEPVADAASPARVAPIEHDAEQAIEKPQCERFEVLMVDDLQIIVSLPCRPFDPRTDLGYPLP